MTEQILKSILEELKTQKKEGQERQIVLTQISTALLGIPDTKDKGFIGDFKQHMQEDNDKFQSHSRRIGRVEKGMIALFTAGAGTGTTVGLWEHIAKLWGGHG